MPIIFFLAPLAGLVVGLVQWFVDRDNVIPYGPFLCLATLGVFGRGPDLALGHAALCRTVAGAGRDRGLPANPGRATARWRAVQLPRRRR